MIPLTPGKYFFPVLLIFFGLGFLLNQLNVWNFKAILATYWPAIIILFGIFHLIDNGSLSITSLIVIGIGVLLLLWKLGQLPPNTHKLIWPTILIVIGLLMIFSISKISPNVPTIRLPP